MTKRAVLILPLALTLLVVGTSGGRVGTEAAATPERPNVILILTDDQRIDDTLDVMPQTLSWFGSGGLTFENPFAVNPVCCPARASIMTGQYSHNNQVKTNYAPLGFKFLNHANTIQRALQEAGYRTAVFGKYLNEWPIELDPHFFDEWSICAPRCNYYNQNYNDGGTIRRITQYQTDYIADRAVAFIQERAAANDGPWYLYLPVYAPHAPFTPAPSYATAPVPPWEPSPAVGADHSDKPAYVQRGNVNLARMAEVREDQLRTLMSVDDLVARVAAALADTGQEENTLAFYHSDNGMMWGEHGMDAKRVPYRPSIRVPLLMRWPAGGVAAGGVDDRLVANIDLAPTILEATGAEPDPPLLHDGRSLLDPIWERDRILIEQWGEVEGTVLLNPTSLRPSPSTPPTYASLVSKELQYIENYGVDGQASFFEGLVPVFREYYDLVTDPWQLRNLLGDGSPSTDPPAEVILELSRQLNADRRCAGTVGPLACP